jgi:hypothetical protein
VDECRDGNGDEMDEVQLLGVMVGLRLPAKLAQVLVHKF